MKGSTFALVALVLSGTFAGAVAFGASFLSTLLRSAHRKSGALAPEMAGGASLRASVRTGA